MRTNGAQVTIISNIRLLHANKLSGLLEKHKDTHMWELIKPWLVRSLLLSTRRRLLANNRRRWEVLHAGNLLSMIAFYSASWQDSDTCKVRALWNRCSLVAPWLISLIGPWLRQCSGRCAWGICLINLIRPERAEICLGACWRIYARLPFTVDRMDLPASKAPKTEYRRAGKSELCYIFPEWKWKQKQSWRAICLEESSNNRLEKDDLLRRIINNLGRSWVIS